METKIRVIDGIECIYCKRSSCWMPVAACESNQDTGALACRTLCSKGYDNFPFSSFWIDHMVMCSDCERSDYNFSQGIKILKQVNAQAIDELNDKLDNRLGESDDEVKRKRERARWNRYNKKRRGYYERNTECVYD